MAQLPVPDLEYWRDLVENVNDLIQSVRPDGSLLYVNRAWCETLGYSREEAARLSVFDVIHPDSRSHCQEVFHRVLAGESVRNVVATFVAKDGRPVVVEVSANCRFQDGKPVATRAIMRDITERKRAEEALRRSQALYHSLVENLPINLARKDAAGRFTFANQQFCALLGKPLDEIIGKTDFDFFPPELAEMYQQDDRRVMATNTPLNKEEQNQAPGGEIRHVQVLKVPIRDDQGSATGIQLIFWDITERKHAEEQLRRINAQLEAITRVQQQFLVEADPRHSFDQMLALLLETTASEYGFIGEVLRSPDGQPYLKTHAITNIAWNEQTRAFYEQHAPAGLEFYNLQTLFGAVITSEAPVIANDPANDPRRGGLPPGHPPLRAFLGLPFFAGDELIGMVGVANRPGGYDEGIIPTLAPVLVTCSSLVQAFRSERQRKETEKVLHESATFLRISQQVGKVGSWEWDASTNRVHWSEGMHLLLGTTPAQFEGTLEASLRPIHPDDLPVVQAAIENVLKGNEPRPLEYRIIRPDGEIRHFLAQGEVIRKEGGGSVLMIGTVMDITERKRAEEERRQLEAQVQRAQKLESLGVLAGGIAHDFNNLLTAILGYASLALMQLPEESPLCLMLREIEKVGQRAAELIQQMLAYSGRGKFVIEALRLDGLVQEITQLLKTVISKKAILNLDLEPAAIEGDATQIRQVVMNLITNASEALEGRDGCIRVRTGIRHADSTYLRSPFLTEDLPAGNYAFIEVEDTGCGMNEATLARIFDPFFTTKFTGRGLGLAAVLGIVRGHRGTIKVNSTPGQGTVFQVLFPCSTTQTPTEVVDPKPEKFTWRGHGTVLVVDDEASIRTICRHLLEKVGFQVREAGDGRAGLDLLGRHRQEIVAVLLDLTMPRLDGLETLIELRRLDPDVPVVIMSGYSESETALHFAGKGANGFIQKPFHPHELVARICQLLPPRAEGRLRNRLAASS